IQFNPIMYYVYSSALNILFMNRIVRGILITFHSTMGAGLFINDFIACAAFSYSMSVFCSVLLAPDGVSQSSCLLVRRTTHSTAILYSCVINFCHKSRFPLAGPKFNNWHEFMNFLYFCQYVHRGMEKL
ncbi:hypothetical protein L9F63_017820, partial [Diploptera punctata]